MPILAHHIPIKDFFSDSEYILHSIMESGTSSGIQLDWQPTTNRTTTSSTAAGLKIQYLPPGVRGKRERERDPNRHQKQQQQSAS